MKCPNCSSESSAESNFCDRCGKKLKETCICWVKNKEPYNCGLDKCPGYRLPVIEKSRG